MNKDKPQGKSLQNRRYLYLRRIASVVAAATLAFQPFTPIIQNGRLVGFTEQKVQAALADISLLAGGGTLTSEVGVPEAEGVRVFEDANGVYQLAMTLAGDGSDITVDLLSPKNVVFVLPP